VRSARYVLFRMLEGAGGIACALPSSAPGASALRFASTGWISLGASLATAGQGVVFLARGAHLAAMRASGLRVEGDRGETNSSCPTRRSTELPPKPMQYCPPSS
jgi:hypothetical protein